jgi:hypothetical protein
MAKKPTNLIYGVEDQPSLATVLVVSLNLVFRIGIRTRVALQLDAQADSAEKIFAFRPRGRPEARGRR